MAPPADPVEKPETTREPAHAKPLPRRLPVAGAPPPLVPARMVNEVLYCERLMHLEWAQGEFADNFFTIDGRAAHARADQPSGTLPSPTPDGGRHDDGEADTPRDGDVHRPYEARALWLSSDRLGLTAKIDVVEGSDDGSVCPIEYKRGEAPDVPEGAYLPERAQLCAHVLLLREHGFRCDSAQMYFAKSRRRVTITIDDALVQTTLGAIARARELAARPEPPPPLKNSPKCDGCSLVGICLPDETNYLREHPTPSEPAALRRLHPSNDENRALYVQEQGARVGIDGYEICVRGKETKADVGLPHTSQVCLFGNVQISTQAVRALLSNGIPLLYFTAGGYFLGRAIGLDAKNVELRLAQYRASCDPAFCLRVARGLVASKIRNSRTLVRRNQESPDPVVLNHLETLAKKAEACDSLESLLGVEGAAARAYFEAFGNALKDRQGFDFEGRNRRPPRDPVNALLSLCYALLTKEWVVATTAVGLDPMLGVFHQPRFGRPALALDLMEEFRPLIADSVVLQLVNTGVVAESDFVVHTTGVALRPHARKRVIVAFERRLDQEITHPVFGYRISYRRVLEVQSRLFARLVLGEIEQYPEFRTR